MRIFLIVLMGLLGALSPLQAQSQVENHAPKATAASHTNPSPGVKLAEAVSATTGLAISPLFGMGAVGAWQWWHTPEEARASVPWHAHPGFWIPALVLVILLASKEPLLYLLPGAKKPLDLLEVFENKASALLAAPLVLRLAEITFRDAQTAGEATRLVTAGWDPGTTALSVIGGCGLLALFFCVWMAAHAINMIILLSPFSTLDMLLRAFRGFILLMVGASAALNPWIGLLVALAVAYLAVRMFGWSWRLMIYGGTLATDILTRRKPHGLAPGTNVRAFLNDKRGSLPTRTRGWLNLSVTGEVSFTGRPLPWMRKSEFELPARELCVVKAWTGPKLQLAGEGILPKYVITLPPRYSGSESDLAAMLGIEVTTESPASQALSAAADWLRRTMGSNNNSAPIGNLHE